MKGAGAEALAAMPKADLYISLNAHKGRPEVLTDWMDGSVVDERDPTLTDESLNPFNPANGPPYPPDFIARYRVAQRARNQAITDWAKAELARVNAAGVPDILFPLYRTWGDLRFMDGAIDPSDRPTPGCYAGHPAQANRRVGIGRANSLKTWLSMWSLETSRCQGAAQLAKFDLPSLVVQSTGDMGVFPCDAAAIHEAIASPDKQLIMTPGAHYFEDSEAYRHTAVDLMAAWIRQRAG
jgi:pimeloyl-ACP methyl ester carboxylesterase